jgi:hypothetical protein
VTNRTFYHTLYNKAAVLKITSQMFDINFYEAVIGFVDLNNTFKQKPQEVIPSKTVGGKTIITLKLDAVSSDFLFLEFT